MRTWNPTVVYDADDECHAEMAESPVWHDGLWVLRSDAVAEIQRLRDALLDCYRAAAFGPAQLIDGALRTHVEITAKRALEGGDQG